MPDPVPPGAVIAASDVADELANLEAQGLRRHLRTFVPLPAMSVLAESGAEVVNFSSNDYLGLAASEELKAAMCEGVGRYGSGSGASRLVCGTLRPHQQLEERLAAFKKTEAALTFSSGYATSVGVIPALCGKDDVILLDKLSHASLIDGARLSGATIRVFPHNHLEKLERLLAGARSNHASRRVLIVTESIFSMDGDAAALREIVTLKERYGAWLMLDEAHAVGVLGPEGRGLAAQFGVEDGVEIQMGTLSKALGVSGGYIAASREVVDLCLNKARSLIYSTAPPPAVAHAAVESVNLIASAHGDALRARLFANRQTLENGLQTSFADLPAAILPLLVGDERAAVEASTQLLERGYLIPAIRYPTVSRGSARLRLTMSAAHEKLQIEGLVASLLHMMPQLRQSGE
ncbi:8-amino-7-oxononanoate synthase [Verrucomicrobium sp. BvORR034]|uniref:8-amino-7-oxononanoate synthase n=1 Tax=Verrucomicrobium sp. BvORR034 TaxID=1396418 RepID=UPI000679D4C4|nr:8-amino-7-oxononanoate synthase [Verrucomicrobium sp. BvORR034]